MNDKLWYAIGLDITPLKRQAREAQNEFRKIDKVAVSEGQKIDKTFRGIGASLKSLVPIASFATAGLMLKQLATDAYRFERSFSMAMREVQTISQAVEKDFKGISDELMNLAANGPDNAIQLANAYYGIVSAGHDGAKGLEILRVSSEAATAGLTETKIAADGITTVLNAWGKDASEAANIAD
ncbi:MAG: phage tail tape measure protein [Mariniphaga sp.]